MPLLGKRPFDLGSQQLKGSSEEAPYLIPHTKERFRSESEFEKRKDLYSQAIWTCRATGHINLTHEDAWKSEKIIMDQLKTQYPKCFEKDVLEVVHHNTLSLDQLVDKTWLKLHQQLVVGENIKLRVKVADKLIPAKIVGVDKSPVESKEGTNGASCNSPSSDKENSSDDKDKSPKKWVPPKLLPYMYSIELDNEAKVIHSVPAGDLIRMERAPSKDLLRLFIRISALRTGNSATSPWVVNSDLVEKHKLVNKFADFFLSPAKMAEASKRAEECSKKRKLSNGTPNSCKKRLKLDKSESKKGEKKKRKKSDKQNQKTSLQNGKKKEKSLLKKDKSKLSTNSISGSKKKSLSPSKKTSSPRKTPKDTLVVSDSDDELSLAKLKRKSFSKSSDGPLYQLADQTTPKKKKAKVDNDSSDENIPLAKINTSTSTPKKNGSKMPTKKQTPQKQSKKSDQNSGKVKSKPKVNSKAGKKDKSRMKQVTLFDLTKKGKTLLQKSSSLDSPHKSSKPSPSKPPPTPAIIRRLLNSKRDTLTDKMKYSMMLKKAVALLTPTQLKQVPEKLREEIQQKQKLIEEKAKIDKMTPEEKEAYLKEKRENAKKIQKAKLLQKLRDQRKRFEDTDLDLTPLPAPKLVPTPEGFPNELFGEVAMVTEFINCYGGLLMPDSEYPIHTDALMKALVGGSTGFTYLSRVLDVLLQTLLQDELAKELKELNTPLSDIAVSPYTASELVRLCLRCDDSYDEDDEGDVPEEIIHILDDTELYQMEVEQKLCVLRGLCSRLLATYSVQDYMDEQQRKANALTRQKNSELKQLAAQKKSVKQETAEEKSTVKQEVKDDEVKKEVKEEVKDEKKGVGSMSITSFYGKNAEDSGEDSANDWGSIVKRRRVLAAQAAAEKEKRDRERRIQKEKEYREEREKEKLRKTQERIGDAINLARMVLRQDPIGTDRHHDRYWVFTNTTPGLYVEKGWMGQEINYNVAKPVQSCEESEGDEESIFISDSEENDISKSGDVPQTGMTPMKIKYQTKRQLIEKSVPHPGQNLWLTYRSQKDLDALLKALHPQGIRESLLKNEIKKRYDEISRAILQAQRTNLELRVSDGDKEMMDGLKKELIDMELRLRNGGLGGVEDYEGWEEKMKETEDLSVMGDCLLEVQAGITEKFLQGFMKPIVKADSDKKDQQEGGGDEGEDSKEAEEESVKVPEKEDKREKAVRLWKEAIASCQTFSRLHVLMAVLDSCVKWEKSAENAKCKICRKKGDDDRLLLCDECNQAFHIYCLRPALSKVPTVDWFCPACKPRRQPTMRRIEQDSESEEEEEKEEACRECGGDDKLIVCSKCPAAYHTQCHDPPLRHPPRGLWECSDCKNGRRPRKRGKLSRKANHQHNYYQDASDEDSDEEQAPRSRSRSSRNKKSVTSQDKKVRTRTSSSRNASLLDSSSSLTPTSRSSRRAPSELSLCEEILSRVMKHKLSWPFLEPVDKKQVPDYYTLIKKPMDFQTMQKKCTRLSYASPQEFIEDAALVFENAESYNKPDSDVFTCMREVEKVFKEQLKKLLPDWPYYRTIVEHEGSASGNEAGRRRSHNK